MRLKHFITENNETIVYLDMDGVLTDFEKAFIGIDGSTPRETEKHGDDAFWDHVKKGGLDFWSKMPWMKGGKELWNYVKKSNVEILSAPARAIPESNRGKEIWIKRELGHIKLNLKRAREKHEFASPNAILIDDNKDNIDKWNTAGGKGIWHTSADKTIRELKNLGI